MTILLTKLILLSRRLCSIRHLLLIEPNAHSTLTRADKSSLLNSISWGSFVLSGKGFNSQFFNLILILSSRLSWSCHSLQYMCVLQMRIKNCYDFVVIILHDAPCLQQQTTLSLVRIGPSFQDPTQPYHISAITKILGRNKAGSKTILIPEWVMTWWPRTRTKRSHLLPCSKWGEKVLVSKFH